MTHEIFSEKHWTEKKYRQRVTKSQAQEILLNHETIIFQGNLYRIEVESIGAGIYEVYKTPYIPKG